MHHIGKKEFYEDVKHKIDSLQKLDYTVFYEGVINKKETDSLISVKNFKKVRKLLGFFPETYLDTSTNIIAGNLKYSGKHKLTNQPKPFKLSIDSLTAVNADVSLSELIYEFEKNNKEIKLDDCDLKFDLRDKNYKCRKPNKELRKIFLKEYLIDYRNEFLANKILKSKKSKILVIYGKYHYHGLLIDLYKKI